MRRLVWLGLLITLLVYIGTVLLFGYGDSIALSIHFSRFALTTAALIIFLPRLDEVFAYIPAPDRHYMIFSINFILISNWLFSVWNGIGLIFKVNTNVFSSPVSGALSFLVVISCMSLLLIPSITEKKITKIRAVAVGIVAAIILVFGLPQAHKLLTLLR